MRKIIASMLAVALLGLAACGNPEDYKLSITKTSKNTWTIYDPDNGPDAYLDKTCATEGREVLSVQTPGEAYQWLYVVCAAKPGGTANVAPTTTGPSSSYTDAP